jgi:hypothetical protein
MNQKEMLLIVLCGPILLSGGCTSKKTYAIDKNAVVENVKYAGVRSSAYGIEPFPEPEAWQIAMNSMQARYPGSVPCAIWIVGVMGGEYACRLEFPADGRQDSNIIYIDYDKHERYLDYFDAEGIKVFLQVEPANADMIALIDIVLNQYKHHPCVIGFGVDVEWYREADNPDWGVKVGDVQARDWEAQVKAHNPDYRLFLKHWDRDWMPPTYRGDIIFVDDSQIFDNFDVFLEEYIDYWSHYFAPNTVFFQIGYSSDRPWWQKLDDAPRHIGAAIAQHISQDCGVFWVDFTLEEVLPLTEQVED